ncbi:MAG TPA: hypothetical protein VF450_20650 [Noviherbaspirillum sp.]|jgi:hypothetical protein
MVISQQAAVHILASSLLRFCFLGGVLGIAVGLGLLFRSAAMFRMFDAMNRWVSFRKAFKPLEIPRDSSRFFQEHRRVVAAVVVAAAFFTLYNLLFRFNVSHAAQLIGMRMKLPVGWVEWLLASLVWFLLIGNTVAIAVGAMLAFAPVPMARLELASARWISTRRFMKVTDTMHDEPDHWVHHSPRAIGAVLTLLATAEVVYVGTLIF